jgi:AraC-like DNA-binding protein
MMRDITSIEDFYRKTGAVFPEGISHEVGHFNVFRTDEVMEKQRRNREYMPYNRRDYYKISLIQGKNRAEYADKVINIEANALLFATPRVPYHWVPLAEEQDGYFCIFTPAFLGNLPAGILADKLPIFQPSTYPVFQVSESEALELQAIFAKMYREMSSNYVYKYDLLRTYLMELIHYGQKLQPALDLYSAQNASSRVTSLFIELLERQFPIESPHQRLALKTAGDYADRLAVHVNHLNKVLKEITGNTTTHHINNRILQEAKILLKQTDWTITDIAYCLGFEEIAHFSNFFKKHTSLAPLKFRS